MVTTCCLCVCVCVCVQGHTCAASPNFNHMLPQVFNKPDKYDPERFAPPREEDKAKPFSLIGFGGGRHACLGTNFAYLQVGVGLHYLCRSSAQEGWPLCPARPGQLCCTRDH